MFDDFYKNKRVLVTGHTGFKGSWLSLWLISLGAEVVGVALEPTNELDNYNASHLREHLFAEIIGDIRNPDLLKTVIAEYSPTEVIHLAAQPLVRDSYVEPRYTYEVNVLGTLNVLEAIRDSTVNQAILVTSDKCYENVEQIWGYRETDRMGGYDPYSSSKGCAELLISSYRSSFFNPNDYDSHKVSLSSVRAGNVIGGGDWSKDRLIPDCIKAIRSNKPIAVRSPHSTRPWEHVLEPLSGYLRLGQLMGKDPVRYSTAFNFGPDKKANIDVWSVVTSLIDFYGAGEAIDVSHEDKLHESNLLYVDPTKAHEMLGWSSVLDVKEAIKMTVDWYRQAEYHDSMYDFCLDQIEYYSRKLPY